MNRTLVYIGESLLDLFAKSVIAITYQFIDIRDLKVRRFSYTSGFDLPPTNDNLLLLGSPQNVNSNSSIPYTKVQAKCFSNGLEYFKGNIQVTKTQRNIKASIFEPVINVFDSIKGKKLYQVDVIDPTAWNASNIDGFRLATTGVLAPVINWGQFDTATPAINSTLYLPSYFYSEIITAILENTGFTFVGDILTHADFTDLIIPFSGSFNYVQQYQDERTFSATNSAPQIEVSPTGAPGQFKVDGINTVINQGLMQWYETGNSRWVIPNFSSTGNIGTARFSIYYDLTVVVGTGVTDMFVKIALFKNSVEVASTFEYVIDTATTYEIKGTFAANIAIQDSDIFEVYIVYSDETTGDIDSITVNEIIFSGHVTTTPNRNFLFHNYLLPDIDQIELIEDFFTRFGVFMSLASDGVTITLNTLKRSISDKSQSQDWTEKRVKDVNDQIVYEYGGYAQNNYFNYDTGEDVSEFLGRGTLLVNNENLETEDDYFDSVFENTDTAPPSDDVPINMASIPVYDGTSVVIGDFINEPGLKILTLRARLDGEPDITFNSVPRSDYRVAYFVDQSQSKDTGFQYFIDSYYSELQVSFDKTKLIERSYKLSVEDMIEPPLIIYDSGNYFLVNKIPKFIPSTVTDKVELLRIF